MKGKRAGEIIERVRGNTIIGGRDGEVEELAAIGGPAIPVLVEHTTDEAYEIRDVCSRALIRIGEPAIPALLDKIDTPVYMYGRSEVPSKTIIRIGKPAVPYLLEELEKGAHRLMNAIHILGKIGDSRATGPLIDILQEREWHWKEVAAKALGEIGDLSAVPYLLDVLKNASDNLWREVSEELQIEVIRALGKICKNNPEEDLGEIIEALSVRLQAADAKAKKTAAGMLGELGDERAIPALINALGDSEGRKPKRAAAAIRIKEWDERGETVSEMAVKALARLGRNAIHLLAAELGRELGPEKEGGSLGIPDLIEILGKGNIGIRNLALTAILEVEIEDMQTLKELHIAAMKFRKENKKDGKNEHGYGEEVRALKELYLSCSKHLSKNADNLVLSRRLPRPKILKSDGFKRVHRIRRVNL